MDVTSCTIPIRSAVRASIRRPVKARSLAQPAPTSWASRRSPPASMLTPTWASGKAKTASSAAIRMSAISTSSKPKPRQYPWTAATTGCGSSAKTLNRSWAQRMPS